MRHDILNVLVGAGKQESTAKKYIHDLGRIEKITGKDVDQFTIDDYNHLITLLGRKTVNERFWVQGDTPQHHSSSSVRGFIFALKRYWKSTGQKDKLRMLEGIDYPKQKPVRPKPVFVLDDLRNFFDDVWNMKLTKEERRKFNVKGDFLEYRNKFMVIFSYFFACRRSELPKIRLSGVDEAARTIVVTENKMTGKQYIEPATSDIFWHYYHLLGIIHQRLLLPYFSSLDVVLN